jgi:N6-L-threonylcarbamoyladenine synthase
MPVVQMQGADTYRRGTQEVQGVFRDLPARLFLRFARRLRALTPNDRFITLGIETSCDDTALALLDGADNVLCDVISSQTEDHAPFGGVVPELASRKHLTALLPMLRLLLSKVQIARDDINLIAVTAGPGLMGALLVGVMAAKGLSQAWNVPVIGVNHLEGHIFANVLASPGLRFPFLCLIASGGHTEIVLARGPGSYILLGGTRDDAAGEAYDKAAKMMGLGYPGGPAIERAARDGDEKAFDFPVAMKGSSVIEFSFSGLKTSLRTAIQKLLDCGATQDSLPTADLCASFQRAVTESLLGKVKLAMKETGAKRIAISGGVSANESLRTSLASEGEKRKWEVFLPPVRYCTDNAVMIAAAGYDAYKRGQRSDMSLSPDPSWNLV